MPSEEDEYLDAASDDWFSNLLKDYAQDGINEKNHPDLNYHTYRLNKLWRILGRPGKPFGYYDPKGRSRLFWWLVKKLSGSEEAAEYDSDDGPDETGDATDADDKTSDDDSDDTSEYASEASKQPQKRVCRKRKASQGQQG